MKNPTNQKPSNRPDYLALNIFAGPHNQRLRRYLKSCGSFRVEAPNLNPDYYASKYPEICGLSKCSPQKSYPSENLMKFDEMCPGCGMLITLTLSDELPENIKYCPTCGIKYQNPCLAGGEV